MFRRLLDRLKPVMIEECSVLHGAEGVYPAPDEPGELIHYETDPETGEVTYTRLLVVNVNYTVDDDE